MLRYDVFCHRTAVNTPATVGCTVLHPSAVSSKHALQVHIKIVRHSWNVCTQGSRERVRVPAKSNICGPPVRVDRLKIFALNRKDRLSVAERLGLGWKGLICTVGS